MQTEAQAALEKFVPVAREFCEFIDHATTMDREAFSLALPVKLARICEAGASLPAVQLDSKDTEDEVAFDLELLTDPDHLKKYSHLVSILRSIFGHADVYWVLFNPLMNEPAVQGTFLTISRISI
jgi:hypothetical protein